MEDINIDNKHERLRQDIRACREYLDAFDDTDNVIYKRAIINVSCICLAGILSNRRDDSCSIDALYGSIKFNDVKNQIESDCNNDEFGHFKLIILTNLRDVFVAHVTHGNVGNNDLAKQFNGQHQKMIDVFTKKYLINV